MSMTGTEPRLTLHTPEDEIRAAARDFTGSWWVFAVAGVAWMVLAAIVLRFDVTSVAAVGGLLGVMFLVSAADEAFMAAVRPTWRWAHVMLAIAFGIGAAYCFVSPVEAFWALAAVFGLLLILRGSLDIVGSTMSRITNPVWGLGLVVGILEVLLGFWASQQFFAAQAALVIVWVGFYAVFRGISEIVLAFEVRSVNKDLEKVTV